MAEGLPPEKVEAIIKQVDPSVLEGLNPALQQKVLAGVAIVASTAYSGPVPPASMLGEYNDVIPNGGNRLFTLVESQSAHRHSIETIVITGQQRQSDRGQWMAFTLAVLLIGVGATAFLTGHDWVASVIFGTTVAALAGIFVFGKAAQAANLQAKRPQQMEAVPKKELQDIPSEAQGE